MNPWLTARTQDINLRHSEVFAKKIGHIYCTAQNGQEVVEVDEGTAEKDHRSDDSLGQSVRLVGKLEMVLMDINMPVMDGFEAVSLTGLGDTAAQEQLFTSGMDLFLTKPVKMKELTEILTRPQSIEGVNQV